jgi:hypothetical protein
MARDPLMRKRCGKCKSLKAYTAFAKDRSATDGLQSYCRTCKADRNTETKYGISPEERERLEDRYGNRCWLCMAVLDHTKKERKSCVDHDHHTGRVRGILCASCNRTVGKLGDDLESACRAFLYLYQGVGDDTLAQKIAAEYGISIHETTD